MKQTLTICAVLAALAFVGQASPLNSGECKEAGISYTLWAEKGDNPADFLANTFVRIPENSTFYDAMLQAQKNDPEYTFEATVHPEFGHYITCINNLCEDAASNVYWMLYLLHSHPDPASPPGDEFLTPTGVDSTIVMDGGHYLFWLHHYTWQKH